MRTLKLISLGLVVSTFLLAVSPLQAIENVRGKKYRLTTKHGPWMIMVTSFRDVRNEEQKTDGMTAEEAAATLVFELRQKGIPAYTFSQDAIRGEIDTRDRLGRDDHRIYAAQRDMICVLAGNYDAIDDKVGLETLKYIKGFNPKFLSDPKSGAVTGQLVGPNGQPRGPLKAAFMTINPLIKPEDVAQKSVDPETKFLNSRSQFPLVKNPHKYTLQVMTLTGKSATPLAGSIFRGKEDAFDKQLQESALKRNKDIVSAAYDAEQLARFLRSKPAAEFRAQVSAYKIAQFGNPDIYDAYVYHDRFQSIVTVGGFDSPDDPRINLLMQYYGPELVTDFRLATPGMSPEEFENLPKILTTHTEQLFPPDVDKRNATPTRVWSFDFEPKVIPVPRIN